MAILYNKLQNQLRQHFHTKIWYNSYKKNLACLETIRVKYRLLFWGHTFSFIEYLLMKIRAIQWSLKDGLKYVITPLKVRDAPIHYIKES